MDIIECYRLLELTTTANLEDIKTSYRRLARQFHPDVNPHNTQAQDKFIRITEAYKVLLKIVSTQPTPVRSAPRPPTHPEVIVTVKKTPPATPPSSSPPPAQTPPSHPPEPSAHPTVNTELSFTDQKLKFDTYRQLEDLIKRRSLPRAIAIVEALQARLPNDLEIRQWQALIYQRWGRQLIADRKLNQARAYLKKALKTDPHNKSLWTEINKDFRRIETHL
jgi:tetratricopeptide (TPR) repeat protein